MFRFCCELVFNGKFWRFHSRRNARNDCPAAPPRAGSTHRGAAQPHGRTRQTPRTADRETRAARVQSGLGNFRVCLEILVELTESYDRLPFIIAVCIKFYQLDIQLGFRRKFSEEGCHVLDSARALRPSAALRLKTRAVSSTTNRAEHTVPKQ